MRATGIIRRVDDLGRINIPKNIREEMEYRAGTPIEFFIDKSSLIIRKVETECTPAEALEKILDTYDGELTEDIVKRINQIIDLLD